MAPGPAAAELVRLVIYGALLKHPCAVAPNPCDPLTIVPCDVFRPRKDLSKVFALSLAGVKPRRTLPGPRDAGNRGIWKPAATETI